MRGLLLSIVRAGYRLGYLILRVWWFLRRPQTRGAAVALWHDGRVLLVRTSYRNCYSLPGGFARREEPSEQAARRELREEVGIELTAQILQHAWSGTVRFESRRDTVDIWETTVEVFPPLHLSGWEIVWAGWMSPSEALAQPLLPHLRSYLTQR
jgi:8-oxo-dGTP diphosphatase